MIRTLLIDTLLFLLPFVLYGLYLLAADKAREDEAAGRPHPWVALFCAGLLFAIGGLIFVGLSDNAPDTKDQYHPHWTLPVPTHHG